jgi:hypothetical protein
MERFTAIRHRGGGGCAPVWVEVDPDDFGAGCFPPPGYEHAVFERVDGPQEGDRRELLRVLARVEQAIDELGTRGKLGLHAQGCVDAYRVVRSWLKTHALAASLPVQGRAAGLMRGEGAVTYYLVQHLVEGRERWAQSDLAEMLFGGMSDGRKRSPLATALRELLEPQHECWERVGVQGFLREADAVAAYEAVVSSQVRPQYRFRVVVVHEARFVREVLAEPEGEQR